MNISTKKAFVPSTYNRYFKAVFNTGKSIAFTYDKLNDLNSSVYDKDGYYLAGQSETKKSTPEQWEALQETYNRSEAVKFIIF